MGKTLGQIFDHINKTYDLNIVLGPELLDIMPEHVAMDSRHVYKNSIFLAYQGEHYDSHRFLADVEQSGNALALVVEKKQDDIKLPQIVVSQARRILPLLCNLVYETDENPMDIVAFAGTDGKTTSTQLTTHILNFVGLKTASIGTIGTTIPGRLTIPQHITSPEPPELHQLLKEIRLAGVKTVMIEAASHAMSQKRYETVDFIGAVFTNFSQDHMDYYKTIPAYAAAKKSLFDKMSEGTFVVANAANPTTYYMLEDCPSEVLFFRTKGKTYTDEWEMNPMMKSWDEEMALIMTDSEKEQFIHEKGLIEASDIRREPNGIRFQVTYYPGTQNQRFSQKASTHEVFLPMWGVHNVDNCCTALGVVMAMGIDLADAVEAIPSFKGVPGRVQFIDLGQDYHVVVDFAHTPAGVEALLEEAVINKADGKLWVTATAAGGRDKEKRLPMGRLYSKYADEVLLCTENIYNEDPNNVLDEIAEAFLPGTEYKRFLLRTDAIRYGIDHMQKGDIFLILGSAKLYININDVVLPWNEADYAFNILLERRMREETERFAASFE